MTEVRIAIRVRPGASRTAVGGAYGDDRQLVVAVNAPPVDGAANDQVVAALAKALGVRRGDISIAIGATGRSKVVAVTVPDDAAAAALRERLEQLRV